MSSIDKINVGGVDFDITSSPTPVMAPVETGTTATQVYVVGDYVIVGSTLHEVTAAIAIGDTFTEGTNISTSTSLGDEIKEVKTDVNQLNNDLTANNGIRFDFAYSNGNYGYLDENGEFKSFSSGAIYLGRYSTNTQIDVSELNATDVSQFILVPTETSYSRQQGQGSGVYTLTYTLADGSLTLANGMLTINLATGSSNYGNVTVNCDLYFVGARPSTLYGFNGNLDLLVEWDAWTQNSRAGLTVLADDGTTVYSSTNAASGNYGAFTFNFQGNIIARKKGTYVYMGLGASGVYGPSHISVDVGEVICVHSRSSAGGTPNGILIYRVPD